ncbi:CHASE3 domain-containing protein [Sinimarinibacterium thermocellulolyticum]
MTENWLNDRGLRVKAILVLGSLFGLFAITAALFLLNQREVHEARRLSEHTVEVLHAANGLILAAVSQQSALRGYGLTSDARFLAPYQSARTDFEHHAGTLKQLTADNPEQQARLLDITRLMAAWQLEFATPLLDYAESGRQLDRVVELIKLSRGRELMDTLRARGLEFIAVEESLLQMRSARLADALDNVRRLAIGLLLAAALSTAIFMVAIQRTLVTPMNRLTALIGRLTGGDLDLEVPYTERKDEVGAIAGALERFRCTALQIQQR